MGYAYGNFKRELIHIIAEILERNYYTAPCHMYVAKEIVDTLYPNGVPVSEFNKNSDNE